MMKDNLTSPQVIAAMITSTVAIILAVLPTFQNNSAPAPTAVPPTPTVIEMTATDVPPTATDTSEPPTATDMPPTDVPTEAPTATDVPPTDIPTETPIPATATDLPTQTPVPPTATDVPTEAPPANLLLMYDDAAFTIYNQSSAQMSVSHISFRSSSGRWDASQWGVSLTNSFPANDCLRMRDATSGQRQPPAVCGNLHGLQLVAGSTLFWLNTDKFEVSIGDTVIATCSTSETECPIFVPS